MVGSYVPWWGQSIDHAATAERYEARARTLDAAQRAGGRTVGYLGHVMLVPRDLAALAPIVALMTTTVTTSRLGTRSQGRLTTRSLFCHVRLAGGGPQAEAAMLRTVREQLRTIDDRVPVLAVKTMREHLATDLLLWVVRTGANMFTVFGAVAVFLAVIGMYGVKAYVMSSRLLRATRVVPVRALRAE